MAQIDVSYERSLEIVKEILENLKELRMISPCTLMNCPHIEQIDELGVCPDNCRYLPLEHEKNKLYFWVCGS